MRTLISANSSLSVVPLRAKMQETLLNETTPVQRNIVIIIRKSRTRLYFVQRSMFTSGHVTQAIAFAACNATKWSDVSEERPSLTAR